MNTNELITKLHSEAIEKQQKINELHERIDKTIKYIENNGEKQYNIHDNYRGKWYSPDDLDNINDILKGEE